MSTRVNIQTINDFIKFVKENNIEDFDLTLKDLKGGLLCEIRGFEISREDKRAILDVSLIDYKTFSERVFTVVGQDISSRTIIKSNLYKLSKDFNIPYETVVDDFNEFNHYVWCIEIDDEESE